MIKRTKKIPDSKRFSILTDDLECCIECGSYNGVELHEIYHGQLYRERSKEYGMVIPLCLEHHKGTEGVHGTKGHNYDLQKKKEGQAVFEEHYPDLDFRAIFGQNYLI